MKNYLRFISGIVAGVGVVVPLMAAEQGMSAVPPSLITPDRVETRIGTLEFKNGEPKAEAPDAEGPAEGVGAQTIAPTNETGMSQAEIIKRQALEKNDYDPAYKTFFRTCL